MRGNVDLSVELEQPTVEVSVLAIIVPLRIDGFLRGFFCAPK